MNNKNTILILAVVAIVVIAGTVAMLNISKPQPNDNLSAGNTEQPSGSAETNPTDEAANTSQPNPIASVDVNTKINPTNLTAPVKEFTMTSFVEMVDGKPKPQYSLKEITVNRGDLVRIKITVTAGTHNFNLDEFNIYAETPLNQEVTVEFTADKAGEFIYYCSIPGHRANGHWGTLKVI